MRFLLRFENHGKYSPKDRKALSAAAFGAVRNFQADVGNLRVSSRAVELDLLLVNEDNLQNAIGALERTIGRLLTKRKLDVIEPFLEKSDAVRLGLDLFNEERYWESHEALESAWRLVTGEEKEILHGLILLDASLVHLQKDEPHVSLSIMNRALAIFSVMHGKYVGIDLDEVYSTINRMVGASAPQFFKIIAVRGNR
jgi:hypothetical protein